jgi:hypothetical protein
MHGDKRELAARRAGEFWAGHGRPSDGYGEFYFQAVQEIALVEELSKVSTQDCVDRLRRTWSTRAISPSRGPRVTRPPADPVDLIRTLPAHRLVR